MNSSKQLRLGAFLSYLSIGLNIAIGLFYTPWMIKCIGQADFGLYTLALSVISLFVFDFGLSSAVTRFLSKYIAEGNQEKANKFLGLVYRLYLFIDVALLIFLSLLFLFIPFIYKELSADELDKFKIIYVFAALFSVLSFPFIPVNGVLTAHEKFVQIRTCDIAHKLVIVVAMSICLLIGCGLYALVIVNALAGLMTILFKLICITKTTKQKVCIRYFNKKEFGEIVGFSGWVTLIALSQRCIFNLAPSILGAMSGSISIAIFGIANTLEGYAFTFASALNGMFLPRVSRIVSDKTGDILPLMIRVGRLQIYVIGLVVFGFICYGQEFIHFWVGDSFAISYICSIFIILPSFLQLPQDIGLQTIYAKNEVKSLAFVYTVMALCNVLFAIILVPIFGSLGICFSIGVSYVLRTIGMDIILFKKISINIFEYIKKTYVSICPWIMTVLIISYFINKLDWPHCLWALCLKILIFTCLYSSVMFVCSMNKDEKSLLLTPLRKILKI